MAQTTITALPLAFGIDATTDWLAIDRTSLGVTQRINRNTYLGITGSPVGTSDSQSIGNKTIGVSNTVTLLDTLFTLADNADPTKLAQFQLSGITTSTTRTYTLPNASSTLADISTAQTFTNKTLTSPVITGGSIDNSTITVDSIAGHTISGNGTVYGLSIHSGVIQTAGAGTSTLLTTNAVQGNQIATNAITIGYAQITTNFTTTTTTTDVDVTGLSVTVTVPAGARTVRITAFSTSLLKSGTTGDLLFWRIKEGSTQLNESQWNIPGSNFSLGGATCQWVNTSVTPGSHTYKISVNQATAGTITVVGAATKLSYIHVEMV